MPSSLYLPSLIAVPPKSMPITCVMRFGFGMPGFGINLNSINRLYGALAAPYQLSL